MAATRLQQRRGAPRPAINRSARRSCDRCARCAPLQMPPNPSPKRQRSPRPWPPLPRGGLLAQSAGQGGVKDNDAAALVGGERHLAREAVPRRPAGWLSLVADDGRCCEAGEVWCGGRGGGETVVDAELSGRGGGLRRRVHEEQACVAATPAIRHAHRPVSVSLSRRDLGRDRDRYRYRTVPAIRPAAFCVCVCVCLDRPRSTSILNHSTAPALDRLKSQSQSN